MAAGWDSLLAVVLLLGVMGAEVGAQTDQLPFFFSAPPDGAVFYLEAGKPFTGLQNILLYDNDANNTANGNILMTVQRGVTVSRGVYEGANPGAEPICSGSNLDPTATLKCRYFCPEFPATLSPTQAQVARCAQWPVTMKTVNSQNFSLTYWRNPTTNVAFTNRTVLNFQVVGDTDWSSLINFANPYRRVCVTIATQRCWNLLYRVPAQVASCQHDMSLPRRACLHDIFPDALNSSVVKVGVGQTLVTNVYFDLLNGADSIQIAVASDPGLPNGASIGPLRGGPNFDGGDVVSNAITTDPPDLVRYVYSREITFTPTERDAIALNSNPEAGVTYPLCFISFTSMNGTSAGVIQGPKVCTKIMVVRPEPKASVDITCPSCTAPLPINFTAMVRCPYAWNMILWERKDFDPAYPIDGQAPAAVAGQAAPLPMSGYQTGLYQPMALPDPNNPLPMGARITDPVANMLCRDSPKMQPFNLSCGRGLQRKIFTQQLVWQPTRGMENSVFQVCFLLSGARGIDASIVAPFAVCSTVLVSKCKVCTLPGDTLESIAQAYHTDWLQLWGANVLVDNPRNLAGYGNVTIGPTYVTSKEVELVNIVAGVFGMTMEGFVDINPDLRGVTALTKGTPVCILPPVCKSPDMSMGM